VIGGGAQDDFNFGPRLDGVAASVDQVDSC